MSASPNPPQGFREGHMGDLACPHRDLSVCDDCDGAHDEIVDVIGQHFWVADPRERVELLTDLARYEDRKKVTAC